MTFKVFNSIVLLGKAYTLIDEKKAMEKESDCKKFDKQDYIIDQSALDKFEQVYQKSPNRTKSPQDVESSLSQSIPNIHKKCAETELRKTESVMELSVSGQKKLDIHSDILEEKHESSSDNDLLKLSTPNEQSLEPGVVEVLGHSVQCTNDNEADHSSEDFVTSVPSTTARRRLTSTESTV
jgi:hypothetical protein